MKLGGQINNGHHDKTFELDYQYIYVFSYWNRPILPFIVHFDENDLLREIGHGFVRPSTFDLNQLWTISYGEILTGDCEFFVP